MGLLDDAIREHLELKRRKGANPSELARDERDALGNVEEPPGSPAAPSDADEGGPEESMTVDPADHRLVGGQETVELDMESVLVDAPARQPPPSRMDRGMEPPASAPDQEDSLEWEMPAGADPEEDPDDGEAVEDVLEETPDFLRDTPEQERLWFEQRPPRDFDFNE